MKRVVTGVTPDGKSCVTSLDELEPGPFVDVWRFEPEHVKDIIAGMPEGVPALWVESATAGGARFTIATFPPVSASFRRPPMQGLDEEGWHVTRTVDFLYCASGTISLLLDEAMVNVETGDFVVQQATRHAWRNESDEPAVMIVMTITPFKD